MESAPSLSDAMTALAGIPPGLVNSLRAVVTALEAKDVHGVGHAHRVATYSSSLAVAAGFPPIDVPVLSVGTWLHDIGKIAVPDRILQKPDRLTVEEFQVLKAHPVVGAAILSPIFAKVEPRILDVVEYHHERFDGKGYPKGLVGQAIPLWSRVCAIADAWDAMTSMRPYRSPLSTEEAIEELLRGRGTQFDPDLVLLFVERVVPMSPWSNGSEPT